MNNIQIDFSLLLSYITSYINKKIRKERLDTAIKKMNFCVELMWLNHDVSKINVTWFNNTYTAN